MATIAFIVHLEDEDPMDAPAVALDIQDALESAGFTVSQVNPWARNTLPPTTPLAGQPVVPQPTGL